MATSGITSYGLQFDEILQDAIEQAGGEPTLGGEAYFTALRALNQLFIELQNRGVPLFSLERTTTVLTKYASEYTLASDTIDLLELTSRTPTRIAGGTATSSDGGTADNAFDGDLSTTCTQTAINGNISYAATGAVLIVSVGFNSYVTRTYNLVFEVSTDNITWTTYHTIGSVDAVAGQTYMHDVAIPLQRQYMRLRETGGAILDMDEVYFISANQDLQMQRISYDDYITIPNKQNAGRPTSYYVERNASNTKLVVWPVPDIDTYSVYYLRIRKLESATALAQDPDLSYRFLPLITSGLAYKMALRRNNVNKDMLSQIPLLKAEYDNQFMWAMEEDRERSPTIIVPRLRL